MSEYKNHINYTASDIQRYVQGKMSPAEMHAMEKAALEDPFLADAIEGMQQAFLEHNAEAVTGPLEQARTQLKTRVKPAGGGSVTGKVVSFQWWKLAAAAVVIVVGALWIFNLSSESKAPLTVAQTKHKEEVAPAPADVQQNEVVAADSAVAVVTPSLKPVVSRKIFRAKTKDQPSVTDTAGPQLNFNTEEKKEAIADALASRQQQVPQAAAPKQNDFNNRPTELITIAKNDSPSKAFVMNNNKALSGVVKGIVTDPFRNPVANAYVQYTIPGRFNRDDNRILTDKTGQFNIPTTDSVVNVSVNVVGYGTQNFRLQNNASLNELQLQPNSDLQEVVVTKLGKKSSGKYRSSDPKVVAQDAEPVYGWLAYEQYLEKNKVHPAGYENVTGTVTVSFIVNRKGELSDFKIEKSLGKQLDDEAIRLIAQGPAWKLVKGRKARTTVMVKF